MIEKKDTFLDKPRLDNLTNEIWKSAERLRGKFKQYEYQKVVLPMIVLRRLECVLVDWRDGYDDPKVKIFLTSDFAYHKVEVVFWQTDAEADKLLEGLDS